MQGGRRGGAAATGGGKAEVAGAIEAADYRRGGSCGNGGRQSGGGRRRSGCRLPARWKLRQWGTARRNNGGGGDLALVRFGWHRAGPFWLVRSWSVLASYTVAES